MPPTRVLHLSDLHFGAGDDEAIERGAPVLIEQFRPELVIASGDLGHRGRPDQLARASRFLHSLERPVLAVPGNHDIPYTFPGRFTHAFRAFERRWETTGAERGVVVSIAPGLGQPRPKRHGEARGLHVYEVEDAYLRVLTFVWRNPDWGLTAERRFPRGRELLRSEPV